MRSLIFLLIILFCSTASANNNIWSWSFDNQSGYFTTTQNYYGDGFYTLLDFCVTTSTTNASIGCVSNGFYELNSSIGGGPPFVFEYSDVGVINWQVVREGNLENFWWVINDIGTTKIADSFWFGYFDDFQGFSSYDYQIASHWDGVSQTENLAEGSIQVLLVPPQDTDNDTIDNYIDNCPSVSNTDQLDSDGDNQGNACDKDIDGDGVFNTIETAAGTNPNDPSDGDQAELSALEALGINKQVPAMGGIGLLALGLSMLGLGAVRLRKK